LEKKVIRESKLLREFENAQLRRRPVDYRENLRIVEALYEEARALKAFPPSNPLDGIEVDLQLARVINVYTNSQTDRQSTR